MYEKCPILKEFGLSVGADMINITTAKRIPKPQLHLRNVRIIFFGNVRKLGLRLSFKFTLMGYYNFNFFLNRRREMKNFRSPRETMASSKLESS